jgi:hypothetical protein
MRFVRPLSSHFAALLLIAVPLVADANAGVSTSAGIDTARALADAAPDTVLREELRHDVGAFLARRGDSPGARAAAAQLPPGRQAMVLLELAAHLPDLRGKEAEQLALDAQTAKALTTDWRKARVARLLAVTYARIGKFDAAVALAHRREVHVDVEGVALQFQQVEVVIPARAAPECPIPGMPIHISAITLTMEPPCSCIHWL